MIGLIWCNNMTAPTSNLDWFKWNIPRGSEFRTGYSFDASSLTLDIGAPQNAMLYIKNIELIVETGATWEAIDISYPHGDGDVVGTKHININTGTCTLGHIANKIKDYSTGEEVYRPEETSTAYYGYTLDFEVPVKLRKSESDTFHIQFTALTKQVDLRVRGWTINEQNAGFSD